MPEAFVFGPFRLLVTRRELMAHGVPVPVGQRAFEILLLLVSRHGELVTKDELMTAVWPGIVVEEGRVLLRAGTARVSPDSVAEGENLLRIKRKRLFARSALRRRWRDA